MNCDPNTLMQSAREFWGKIPEGMQRAVQTYLLCQIAQSGSGACSGQSGSGSPVGVVTPDFVDQLYHDTVADTYYRSTGLTSGDWVAISGSGGDLIFGGNVTDLGDLFFDNSPGITSASLPNLVQISVFDFGFDHCPLLTTVTASNLQSIAGAVFGNDCPSLTTVDFNSLVTVIASFDFHNCTNLSTILVPLWIPTSGTIINLSNCSLNTTSVELILRRCVLATVVGCTILLHGGTNAGLASLSAQGQADAATLGAQLTINP